MSDEGIGYGSEWFYGPIFAAGTGKERIRCLCINERARRKSVAGGGDLCDYTAVLSAVKAVKPDAVFHLAAQSLASASWERPQETLAVNVMGTANLLEAVRAVAPSARMLLVGSADQYGVASADLQAITEDTPLQPKTPYGVSKCAQESLGIVYARTYGLAICMTRTFSFGGAGQKKGFVLSDFASGIAAVEAGLSPELCVGNLNSERDFTHIRDVVRAYRLICENGMPGEVYNVGSGKLHSIEEVLDRFLELSEKEIPVKRLDGKKRPTDVHGVPCCHDKLTAETGWQPEIPFETIIKDELEDWRARTSAAIAEGRDIQ